MQQEKILLALGERIRQLREKKGISQEALSFEIKVHRTYVSLIEQARRYPSIQTLVKISEKLEVPLADLFTGVEERAKALSKTGRSAKPGGAHRRSLRNPA